MPKFDIPFAKELTKTQLTCLGPRAVKCQASYKIYPLDHLAALMEVVSKKPETKSIRYLVDMQLNLWFAQEGSPTADIPAHYQITGEPVSNARCLAAGNIKFSADLKTITCINHKSGDFRPSFDSLKWVLAILVRHQDKLTTAGIKFNESNLITLEELDGNGGNKESYELNLAELTAWCEETFHAVNAQINAQPQDIVIHEYAPPARPFFNKLGAVKRMNFGDEDEDQHDKRDEKKPRLPISLNFSPL